MEDKIENAKKLIKQALENHKKVAVACSFGKDSMVTVHLAREVDPNIKVFSVMTRYKPRETFEYLKMVNKKMNLRTVVYIVADSINDILQDASIDVVLLPTKEFKEKASEIESMTGKPIYIVDPDECCRQLKVKPAQEAVKDLDAWISGLRSTEGITRTGFKEIEEKGGLVKINPILAFTEAEVWRYISTRGIPPHPWYSRGYRSLGCAPCSFPGGDSERGGRWKNTGKCGGECGIHTQRLK